MSQSQSTSKSGKNQKSNKNTAKQQHGTGTHRQVTQKDSGQTKSDLPIGTEQQQLLGMGAITSASPPPANHNTAATIALRNNHNNSNL
mgnify:CR=1 FL=1